MNVEFRDNIDDWIGYHGLLPLHQPCKDCDHRTSNTCDGSPPLLSESALAAQLYRQTAGLRIYKTMMRNTTKSEVCARVIRNDNDPHPPYSRTRPTYG